MILQERIDFGLGQIFWVHGAAWRCGLDADERFIFFHKIEAGTVDAQIAA